MKNKLKLIDVNLLSVYTGRILTGVLALMVFGLTVSALLGDGGRHNVIYVCIPAPTPGSKAVAKYEPFATLLGRETRRPVTLAPCLDDWPPGRDLYIMPIEDYLARHESLGIVGVCEIKSSDRKTDSAVLFARAASGPVDLDTVTAGEVAFAGPSSINGFWVQADVLAEAGFDPPARPEEYRFEGDGVVAARVVFGVLHGAYRVGACRLSDLTGLVGAGAIRADEFVILSTQRALPEVVVAARADDATYYKSKLESLGGLLDSGARGEVDAVAQLSRANGVTGLVPLAPAQMDRARALFEQYGPNR